MRIDRLFLKTLMVVMLSGICVACAIRSEQVISGHGSALDGDTVLVAGTRIRLFGIEAIEWQDPLGKETTVQLEEILEGESIVCDVLHYDDFRRPVARCRAGGFDIAAEMVRRGWAANSNGFTDDYSVLESTAQSSCKGLWVALASCRN